MSLREAIEEIVAQMTADRADYEKTTSTYMLLGSYIGALKASCRAVGDNAPSPAPVATGIGGMSPFTSPIAQREFMVGQERDKLRKQKESSEGQEGYEPRMVYCEGGPVDATMAAIPQKVPEGNRFVFLGGGRYKLSDDNQKLVYSPPADADNNNGGKVLVVGE